MWSYRKVGPNSQVGTYLIVIEKWVQLSGRYNIYIEFVKALTRLTGPYSLRKP